MEPIKTKYLSLCNYTALYFKNRNKKGLLSNSLFWSSMYLVGGNATAITLTTNFANSANDFKNLSIAFCCSTWGGLFIESFFPKILKSKHVKAQKGGQLFRAAQIAGLIVPFTAAITINELNDDVLETTKQAEISKTVCLTPCNSYD